jgi:hypothetical protein
MKTAAAIWGILLILSVTSFTLLSAAIIIRGYKELKAIFKTLSGPLRQSHNKS